MARRTPKFPNGDRNDPSDELDNARRDPRLLRELLQRIEDHFDMKYR